MGEGLGRDETFEERMDRNLNDILQELRVLQTGTQILAGFLLTLPFQSRFPDLSEYDHRLFLVAISLAILTTVLLLAPVSVHRTLFRLHRKDDVVRNAHLLVRLGLFTLGLTMMAVLALIFTVVVSRSAGLVAAGVSGLLFLGTWVVMPAWLRRRHDRDGPAHPNRDGSAAPSRSTSG